MHDAVQAIPTFGTFRSVITGRSGRSTWMSSFPAAARATASFATAAWR